MLPVVYGTLLEVSWGALGGLLKPSWTISEAFFDAKSPSKGRPRGFQMEPRRSLEREVVEFAETSKFVGRLS